MLRKVIIAAALLCAACPAFAQSPIIAKVVPACGAQSLVSVNAAITQDQTGNLCTNATGGVGGAGDASAANQTLQITQETAINTVLGTTATGTWDGSSAAASMAIQRYSGVKLEAIRALLAATLTVNLPSGASTAANQTSTNTKLDTLHTDLSGPSTMLAATTCETNSYSNGATSLFNSNLKGAGCVEVARWGGTVLGAASNFGTTPGAVVAAGVNASQFKGTTALVADPCEQVAHVYTRVDIAAAASSVLVTGTASKKTYICSMMLFSAGTTNVGIVEGSGTTCGTSPLGLIGGNTAAKGPNLTAQAGFVAGQGGFAIAGTTVNQNDICLINSAAIQVSGYIVTATP